MNWTGSRRWLTTPLVVLAVLVVVSAGSLGAVAAQDDPGEPHSFYGTVTNDAGDPAPEGVEIFALIDGEVQGSIVVNDSGEYGGPEAFDDKLTVDDGAGNEVVFTVGSPDGPEALESPYDLSEAEGSVTELDLTFPEGAFHPSEAAFGVSIDEEASTLDAGAGEDLHVESDVENVGNAAATQNVTATVAGETVGVESLTIDAGETATVTFTFEADPAYDGEDVEVFSADDSATATLSVSDDGGSGGAPGGPGDDDTGGDTDGDDTDGDGSDDDGSDGSDDGDTDGGSTDGDETDGSETDGTEDDGSDGDDESGGDDDGDGTPGFGVLIGAVAVVGSGLLLQRRR